MGLASRPKRCDTCGKHTVGFGKTHCDHCNSAFPVNTDRFDELDREIAERNAEGSKRFDDDVAVQLEAERAARRAESKRVRKAALASQRANRAIHGTRNLQLRCPHCGAAGYIHTKSVKLKKGVSGGKATGALLTGGLSMLATGLSRKEAARKAHCTKCGSTWAHSTG